MCFTELVKEKKEYQAFIPALEENLIFKMLRTTSSIYKTIKLPSLYKFLAFAPEKKVSSILLYSHVHGLIDCKIDFVN